MSISSNDNATRDPDAHGLAALLLVESLIHGLLERSLISVANAVEFIEVATEVSLSMKEDVRGSSATIQRSITLLEAMSQSLSRDLFKP